MKLPEWLSSQLILKVLIVAVLALVLYFTVREDSNFSSVPWLPKVVKRFLHKNVYLRNLWGFLPIGLIFGSLFDLRSLTKNTEIKRRWLWMGLLMLPIVKELAQIPLPNRHCNAVGMFAGIVGLLLGLVLGHLIKRAAQLTFLKRKPEIPLA
jgi:hypothetical protein